MPLLLEMTNCYSSSYLASFPIMEVEWRAAFCSLWMCYPSVYPARCWPHGSPGDLNKWISLLPGATVLPLRGQYRQAHHEQLCGHAECGCLGAGDECSSYDFMHSTEKYLGCNPIPAPHCSFLLTGALKGSTRQLKPQIKSPDASPGGYMHWNMESVQRSSIFALSTSKNKLKKIRPI